MLAHSFKEVSDVQELLDATVTVLTGLQFDCFALSEDGSFKAGLIANDIPTSKLKEVADVLNAIEVTKTGGGLSIASTFNQFTIDGTVDGISIERSSKAVSDILNNRIELARAKQMINTVTDYNWGFDGHVLHTNRTVVFDAPSEKHFSRWDSVKKLEDMGIIDEMGTDGQGRLIIKSVNLDALNEYASSFNKRPDSSQDNISEEIERQRYRRRRFPDRSLSRQL
jgi:hypothetical protein